MAFNSTHKEINKGLVFNIQKFSLHDGAGIRTLIFLKGCPLSCTWCSNPEGQSFLPELAYDTQKCIGTTECDRCKNICGQHAITEESGKVGIIRERCDNCGACANACPSKALEMLGTYMTVEEVIRAVEEDGSFYVRSGGGLTLSGGEPLSQVDFSYEILRTAKNRGLNTAIETTGICSWGAIEAVGPFLDQIFYDIKCMSPKKHKMVTGVSNESVLENYQKLCRHYPDIKITVRTPIIPGVNDSTTDVEAIRLFINSTGNADNYELLPYHEFGESKYYKLGKKFQMKGVKPPTVVRMKTLNKITA